MTGEQASTSASIESQLAYVLSRYTAREQAIESAFQIWKDEGTYPHPHALACLALLCFAFLCFAGLFVFRSLCALFGTRLISLGFSDVLPPPLPDPNLWKSFVSNSRHASSSDRLGNPGIGIDTTLADTGVPLRDEWHVQEFVGDKVYNLLLAELLQEYCLPHSVTCMFQQGLASNAFQKAVALATGLAGCFKPLVGGKGPASALEVRLLPLSFLPSDWDTLFISVPPVPLFSP